MLAVGLPPSVAMMQERSASDTALAPTSKWILDGEPDQCTLARVFGSGDDQIVLGIVPVPTSKRESLRLKFARPIHFRPRKRARVTIRPSGTIEEAQLSLFNSKGSPDPDVMSLSIEKDLLRDSPSISGLDIAVDGTTVASLAPDGMSEAIVALRNCENRLLDGWGIDAEARSAVAMWPDVDKNGPLLGATSYPKAALQAHAEGTVIVRFHVDKNGVASDCTVVGSSGNAALDQGTCEAIPSTARYLPARDGKGNPIDAMTIMKVTWEIP